MSGDDTPYAVAATGDDGPAVSISNAAKTLDVSPATVRKWLRNGRLRGYSIQHEQRQRLFVFVSSIQALRSGGQRDTTSPPADDVERWRARAAASETAMAYLREAFEEVVAAHAAESESAARLRRALELQHRAAGATAPLDEELWR